MRTPSLHVDSGPDAGESFFITDTLVIGRSLRSDIVLHDEAVSREHARVRPEGVTLVVEDIDSANGTWCNGELIETACRLEAGDVMQVGDTVLTVSLETGEEPEPASTPTEPTVIRPRPEQPSRSPSSRRGVT